MKIMKATSVEEAVALATRLKAEGRYNWFRGQLREWNPASSLERKLLHDPEAKPNLDAKLNRFLKWVQAYPALAYLAAPENIDALFAVLQHYGFPTTYIDFTTEPAVAGFFASDTQVQPEGPGNSVIYCLNTDDLTEFYECLDSVEHPTPLFAEPVTVDVPNLWRLESQHGRFLFANHSWYRYYDMDRIVFPWSGTPAFPPRDQIYPAHKSALEQLLDSYFFNERRVENKAMLRAMAEAAGKQSLFKHFNISKPATYEQESFSSPLKAAEGWSADALKDWLMTPIEQFDATVGRRISISLRSGPAAPSPADQVRHSINNALNLQPKLRAEAVDWCFTGLPRDVNEQLFISSTREAWNGMRNLPYTNDDIAGTISALVILCAIAECRSLDGGMADQAFTRWIADAIYVELGNQDGSYSRAYCSDKGLLQALDPAWIANLKKPASVTSMSDAFSHTHDPRLMFGFEKLASIYAHEVIPSQLALKRPVVLYNPANLELFGLP
ncbi:FRG domain-containing protein [Azotobacter chroococcum]|uniref:FRG domain-containing protein n=1 Tax=Azotobacter chroococcum TaxID=353 RepID=A0A4R1P8P5_9GAMM|nr:FRG domain-containing protein [Azotobacter chroococcum]TBV93140.1 FRG domain-containing protein [Azotobacter chroococcum]TCL18228.1 FRG domain-containing protein [Azotobacter chroococcum]